MSRSSKEGQQRIVVKDPFDDDPPPSSNKRPAAAMTGYGGQIVHFFGF